MPTGNSIETFRPVPGFPAYRVSDHGNLLTCYCPNGWAGMTEVWRPMKPYKMRKGYLAVRLQRDGKPYGRLVHRLVLEAFVGPCPSGLESRHFPDRDRANNRLANLTWGTRQENSDDKQRDGTQVRGEKCKQAKLTEELVRQLRSLRAAGWTYPQLAERFGITRRNVIRTCRREHWAHVE